MSLPTWERGLKLIHANTVASFKAVAPYLGAWIEICQQCYYLTTGDVAPYLGAWIEMSVLLPAI